ncbi:hypothetical protein MPTK1_7g07320 [Marchantia polymorpha subsp. ruderalis]|uniref:Uncharacterized protein n=2 Tax=Marchantia polymorpha TaxID=3197 RepID=A0A176VPS8_MARPO|nr:hypothetical protein AXG93_1504s1220 [Marchantia polymorpha subsp. ruderalis]PTQ34826.1 hypothetical protein MARPO_0076s0062 [Marchantia polymorpha]BBN16552.1 hypothetical protein Mp_7g07320 [Marchantia polymorpha subsp. ruderalis]|eukprot:PTQ34826.1 hypothetical protein MARPO_0076s0062 [Marchantia polymorpha]
MKSATASEWRPVLRRTSEADVDTGGRLRWPKRNRHNSNSIGLVSGKEHQSANFRFRENRLVRDSFGMETGGKPDFGGRRGNWRQDEVAEPASTQLHLRRTRFGKRASKCRTPAGFGCPYSAGGPTHRITGQARSVGLTVGSDPGTRVLPRKPDRHGEPGRPFERIVCHVVVARREDTARQVEPWWRGGTDPIGSKRGPSAHRWQRGSNANHRQKLELWTKERYRFAEMPLKLRPRRNRELQLRVWFGRHDAPRCFKVPDIADFETHLLRSFLFCSVLIRSDPIRLDF